MNLAVILADGEVCRSEPVDLSGPSVAQEAARVSRNVDCRRLGMDATFDDPMGALLTGFIAQDREHAVVGLDPAGTIVGWRAAAERLFGYPAADVLGRSIATIFMPIDQQRGVPRFELEVARVSGRSEDDRWHLRADGSAIWVTGTVTAVRAADDTLLGYVKLMRDRTDLRTQIETLENRAEGLLQREAGLRLMLDTLGHEMRNPLGPLKTAVHLIERQHEAGLPLAASLRIVQRQIALLERLADDLMDITRCDTGRLQLHPEPFELQAMLRDCVGGFGEQAQAKRLMLQLLLPEAPIRIVADPQRLQQVVLNLLGNALKFTSHGGRIVVRAAQEAHHAVVHISDDGAGIAPELLPRIFELFSQGSSAPASGLGIGLALARDIVELHGGNLEARSPGLGKGSEFSVRLPLRPPGEPPAP